VPCARHSVATAVGTATAHATGRRSLTRSRSLMPTVRCVTVGMQHDADTRIDEHSKATQPACACQTCLVHRLLGMPFRYTRGFLRHGTCTGQCSPAVGGCRDRPRLNCWYILIHLRLTMLYATLSLRRQLGLRVRRTFDRGHHMLTLLFNHPTLFRHFRLALLFSNRTIIILSLH